MTLLSQFIGIIRIESARKNYGRKKISFFTSTRHALFLVRYSIFFHTLNVRTILIKIQKDYP
ncbi:MAG: hypothetical protein COZ80_00510 [Ignavibacteria bacterium CG_4_8_14_3_um_filter_37_9]|nr:MAG: hypothetical protein AUJ54_00625 [Ignavibacteria bacterium CG1_02_37_35]PIX00374.1 MAG: hypothetical protein COZ80_00510 [Ignavibacteria bacterium CG_4_8_14_3_um_filter_37_9]PIX92902.1 MAG: hypothetical protein COZ25_13505 [Ignavibacteria bacterium CG_4_10_14_3_um_filter_37_18]PJC58698.1 MAG: hypothetical protein CO025_08565 [Ignavibacteria bacterium CG_4_9_14_0_2_um_filter_37_13]